MQSPQVLRELKAMGVLIEQVRHHSTAAVLSVNSLQYQYSILYPEPIE
ncbi:hypothetical protein [Methyloradius palustris]|nr:hypothetical protein [Methyloradius palustris]